MVFFVKDNNLRIKKIQTNKRKFGCSTWLTNKMPKTLFQEGIKYFKRLPFSYHRIALQTTSPD